MEIELRTGQLRVLILGASVLRSAERRPASGVIVFRDITGQRELERLREDILDGLARYEDAHYGDQGPCGLLAPATRFAGERDPKVLESDAALIVRAHDNLSKLSHEALRCLLPRGGSPLDLAAADGSASCAT